MPADIAGLSPIGQRAEIQLGDLLNVPLEESTIVHVFADRESYGFVGVYTSQHSVIERRDRLVPYPQHEILELWVFDNHRLGVLV